MFDNHPLMDPERVALAKLLAHVKPTITDHIELQEVYSMLAKIAALEMNYLHRTAKKP